MPTSPAPVTIVKPPVAPKNPVDRFFRISERGSSVLREVRGGLATFFTMAYILVLNPIILSSATDMNGHHLDSGQLVTATALIAALSTMLMGVIGNVPVALAAGLGVNTVVALQLAPRMTWPDAMGMVVLAGLCIMILVATGLREKVMAAIPADLRRAISIGIGLFVCFVGLVDSGFLSRNPDSAHTTVPVGMGVDGRLQGWPVLVFCLGALLTLCLLARRVRGAILISIVAMTVLAIVIDAVATVSPAAWGLTVPKLHGVVGAPDFSLLGKVSLFGGFHHAGIVTGILFVFTVLLSSFFDAMGTIIGVTDEAGLLDADGRLPEMGRVLMVDGFAGVLGGLGSCSANTCFVESTAGVGEGSRTGLSNVVTGGLFALALGLTPLATVVPAQAATPALVAVGFLMMSAQIKDITWSDMTLAIPAFLTVAMMPFTYSITDGIGVGVVSYVVINLATGQRRRIPPLLYVVALFFAVYFFLDPIEQAVGM